METVTAEALPPPVVPAPNPIGEVSAAPAGWGTARTATVASADAAATAKVDLCTRVRGGVRMWGASLRGALMVVRSVMYMNDVRHVVHRARCG
ncbi:hypothetical protein GCM10010313_22040 [Streptomyces violarus]|nr:hypothetical protein GCM10010313_22040 [Streptomyces violarus]